MSHRDNERVSRRDPGTVHPFDKRLDSPEGAGVSRPRSTSESSRQSYPSSPYSSRDLCPMSSSKSTADVAGNDRTGSGVSSSQVHKHKFTVSQCLPSGEFHLSSSPSSSRTSFDMKRLMSKPLSLTSSTPANVPSRLGSFPTTSTTTPSMGTKRSTTDPIPLSTSTHSFPYTKFGYLEADIYAPTSYTPRAPISYRVAAGLADEVGSTSCNDASHAQTLPRNHKVSGGPFKRPSLSINPTVIHPTSPRPFPTTTDESSSSLDTFRFPGVLTQSHTASSVTIDHTSGSITQPSVTHPSTLMEKSLTPASQLALDWRESRHMSQNHESDVNEKGHPPLSSNPHSARGMSSKSTVGGKPVTVGDESDCDIFGTPNFSAPNRNADGEDRTLHRVSSKVSRKLSKRRPQSCKNNTGVGAREPHPALDLDPYPTTPVDSPSKRHTCAPQRKSSTIEDGRWSFANPLKASPQVTGRSPKTLGDAVVTILPSPRREGTLSRLMRKLSTSTIREAAGLGRDVPPVPPLPTPARSNPEPAHMRQRSSSADFGAVLRKREHGYPKEQTTVGPVSRIFKRRTISMSPKSTASNHTKPGMDGTSLSASANFSGSLPADHSASSSHLSSSRASTSDEMLITPIEPVPPLPRACTIYTSGTPYPSQASSIYHGVHTTYHDPNGPLRQFSLNNSSPQLARSPSGSPPSKPHSSTAADSSVITILSEANRDVEVPKGLDSLRKRVPSLRKRAISGNTQKATQNTPQPSSSPSTSDFHTLSPRKSREKLMGPKTIGDNESASRSFFNWRRSTSRSRASSIDSPVQRNFSASLTNVAFLEIDPTTGDVPGGRRKRTDDEKDAMWDELMKRSNNAPGGTLQASAGAKLESDSVE